MRLKLAAALPSQYFHCDTYSADLKKTICVARQQSSGIKHSATTTLNGVKRRAWKWIPGHLWWCGSGKCEQGKKIRASLPEQPVVQLRPRGDR